MLLSEKVEPLSRDSIVNAVQRKDKTEKYVDIFNRLGLEALCTLISEGATLAKISRTIGCTYVHLRQWIEDQPKGFDKLQEARAAAGDLYVTLADQVMEDIMLDKDSIARANAQRAHYLQMAGFFDPSRFSARESRQVEEGVSVVFNIDLGAKSFQPIDSVVVAPKLTSGAESI